MINLETTYMGLHLKNPIMAASSGLTDSIDKLKLLAKEGIGAVVLKSIFEEQILREIDSLGANNMFNTFTDSENYIAYYTKEHHLNAYLKLIEEAKKTIDIPVIASINCMSVGEWINFAGKIQNAGADAIELNLFILPSDSSLTPEQIESVYFSIIKEIKKVVRIPVAIKISSYFSSLSHTMVKFSESGIDGIVMFNRFFNPDIDLENESIISSRIFSLQEENSNNLRWIALLSDELKCDLSSTTGIMNGEDVIKNILVGAKTVQIASTLYKNSVQYTREIILQTENWLKSKNYNDINTIRGKLSAKNIKQSFLYERAQFMKYYSDHY